MGLSSACGFTEKAPIIETRRGAWLAI